MGEGGVGNQIREERIGKGRDLGKVSPASKEILIRRKATRGKRGIMGAIKRAGGIEWEERLLINMKYGIQDELHRSSGS